jgi:hypothetical protein
LLMATSASQPEAQSSQQPKVISAVVADLSQSLKRPLLADLSQSLKRPLLADLSQSLKRPLVTVA